MKNKWEIVLQFPIFLLSLYRQTNKGVMNMLNYKDYEISKMRERIYALRRFIPSLEERIRQSKGDISCCIRHGLIKSDYVPFEEYTFGYALARLDETRFMVNSISKEIKELKKRIKSMKTE